MDIIPDEDRTFGAASLGSASPSFPIMRAVMRCILAVASLVGLMLFMASVG